jgi:hypothetical protein
VGSLRIKMRASSKLSSAREIKVGVVTMKKLKGVGVWFSVLMCTLRGWMRAWK